MSDPDGRLTAALQADGPPARDVRFRVEVLLRLERARFRRRVALTLATATVMVACAAVNAPAINAWIAEDLRRLWIVALGALATMSGVAGAPVMAAPGIRMVKQACRRWLYPYAADGGG